jgi:hypothetical protein
VTIAVGLVLVLALALGTAVIANPSLSGTARRFLLWLALVAGILATLRWQGAI